MSGVVKIPEGRQRWSRLLFLHWRAAPDAVRRAVPRELPLDRHDGGAWVTVDGGRPVIAGRVEKMSKSKLNTVDPAEIIGGYGADTARLFMLSDSPPDRDLEWTEGGIDGAWRYINRLWRLVEGRRAELPPAGTAAQGPLTDADTALRRAMHRTIAAVTAELDRLHFNKAVALIRREPDARLIGYGGMLMESFVAVMAMCAAAVLDPGVYFAINAPLATLGGNAQAAAETIRGWGFTLVPGQIEALAAGNCWLRKEDQDPRLITRYEGAFDLD